MRRVVILGRGGAGKSTLARRLGAATGLPVVELDAEFWRPDLTGPTAAQWSVRQRELIRGERWILDGDLGPHDVPEVRLAAADTVILLDFGMFRCVWRALGRGRERVEFWVWVITYRRHWRPRVLAAVARGAPHAELHVLRGPRAVRRFLARVPVCPHRRARRPGDVCS